MGTRMIRKQVYLTPDQDRSIKERARRGGKPEAEVLRGLLERGLALDSEAEVSREEAWRRQVEIMREQLARDVPQQPRTWKREDLYEERLSRYDKHRTGGH